MSLNDANLLLTKFCRDVDLMSPKLLDPPLVPLHSGPANGSTPFVAVDRQPFLIDRQADPGIELPAILDPFIDRKPAVVMLRLAADWIIQGIPVDQLFEENAEGQYVREFTLELLTLVMLDVVCGHHPSVRSGY